MSWTEANRHRKMSDMYRRFDLVWEENDQKVGYKTVVECSIDLEILPDHVKMHVVKNSGVHFLEPRPALRRNMDLMWWEEESNQWVGFAGVVNSRVDPARLPAALKELVRTPDDVRKIPHQYIPLPEMFNPSYARSSQSIGAEVASKSDPKQTWNGLNGTFTSTFPTTPSHHGGLNCSMTKHPVIKGPSFGTTPFFESRIT
eukprot:TRINITY_DN6995_c0_g1_i1.p1 TRINITY_DN6995_c0_g1~~TRINITY_DN6995_c0_g1_i1.p1  ORF type:complete len:201 (+),score=22.03 TRINITY_DN6995_c0_g1_i1:465-1067(+)